MNKVVRINANGTPHVEDHPMHVKKSTLDTIAWTATGNGGPWTITFTNASPIGVSTVSVTKGSASTHHAVTGAAANYAYTIAAAGAEGAGEDPDIIVDD